jgi:hypothetical protein
MHKVQKTYTAEFKREAVYLAQTVLPLEVLWILWDRESSDVSAVRRNTAGGEGSTFLPPLWREYGRKGSRSHFTLTIECFGARANNRRDEKKTLCAHSVLLKYLIEMQCKRNVGHHPDCCVKRLLPKEVSVRR